MKIRRFVLPVFLSIFIIASLIVVMPEDMVAQAGCGPADCPTPTKLPSGGGGGKTKPKPILPIPAFTPTRSSPNLAIAPVNPGLATPTPTTPPWFATYEACWQATYVAALTALASQPPLDSEGQPAAEATADNGNCYKKYAPTATLTATPRPIPIHGGGGPISWSGNIFFLIVAGLMVLIVGILIGAFLIVRGMKPRKGSNE